MINGRAQFQAFNISEKDILIPRRTQVESIIKIITSLINKWKEYRKENAGKVYLTSSIRFDDRG